MKKPTKAKVILLSTLTVGAITFAVHTFWLLRFGRFVVSKDVEIDSASHRVLLMERCISDPILATLDRAGSGRIAEYEYWAELRSEGRLVAKSDRVTWDSTNYDHPRIDSADASGVTVSLDPRRRYPSIHRFNWIAKQH